MKKGFCFCTSLLLAAFTYAQEKPYAAGAIPDELKKNAHSVIREEQISFEVKSTSRATYKVHKVVTVLDEDGATALDFRQYTDQFSSLENAFIQLYDSGGTALQRYKKSDFSRQLAGQGLVPDGKVYYLDVPPQSYPVTMLADYEVRFTGLINYPDYEVQLPEQSVQNSTFTATVPALMGLRYKGKNTNMLPVLGGDGINKTYTWTVKNLPALWYEAGSVSYESRYPHILLSPNKFELDGYPGDMTSWENFGKWYGELSKDAGNLTPQRTMFFQQLVKDAATEKEKIAIIYNYLQANCRYVLIALGIGGFKPFPADFVDSRKYGDCKALSNYAQAGLRAVGIKSYQALINAAYNKEPVDPDFPHNSFNHVILCVPQGKDSIWLECTSNTTDCGELGNFTENRNALLITETGGKLVPTPRSTAAENSFASSSTIDLEADGSGTVNTVITASGEYRQQMLSDISNQKKDDQKGFLVNAMGYAEPDDFDIQYDEINKKAPTRMSLAYSKIPEFTAGKKLFLNPRMYKIWNLHLPDAAHRTLDYYFEHPFIKTDTTIYRLPAGFDIEMLPKAKKLDFAYGSFDCRYSFDTAQKTVRSIARLELTEYKVPAAKFAETKKFFAMVQGEYTDKIVIRQL